MHRDQRHSSDRLVKLDVTVIDEPTGKLNDVYSRLRIDPWTRIVTGAEVEFKVCESQPEDGGQYRFDLNKLHRLNLSDYKKRFGGRSILPRVKGRFEGSIELMFASARDESTRFPDKEVATMAKFIIGCILRSQKRRPIKLTAGPRHVEEVDPTPTKEGNPNG